MPRKKEDKLHPWNAQLAVADILIILSIVMLLRWFPYKTLFVISSYFLVFPYLYFTQRKQAMPLFLLSLPLAFLWVFFSRSLYSYNHTTLVFFGINVYSFFAFAIGLGGAYLFYSHVEHVCKNTVWKQVVLATLLFWILLIGVEGISYHFSGIENEATSQYPGLPFCNCIHAPLWMQIMYFLLGPLYFGLVKFLGIPNPHIKKKIQR